MVELVEALRLDPQKYALPRLVFVGAGGKSTALFQTARGWLKLYEKAGVRMALAGATTHLAKTQLSLADRHVILPGPEDLMRLENEPPDGLILFTGPLREDGRTQGIDAESLEKIRILASRLRTALFLEADGSRQMPLKAPASHEPAIPAWVDQVVVVAGLSGLNKPLDDDHVHRPDVFARLSGLAPGEVIDGPALARVLSAEQGGLKRIPARARRLVLFNQADTPGLQSQAYALTHQLLEAYDAVLIAALESTGSMAPGGVLAVHEPTAGIILAAGGSRRLGRPKQLLEWRGEPLVRHVVKAASRAGLEPLKVVTGASTEDVEAALHDLPVQFVPNSLWEAGQATSVIAGVESLPSRCGAAVFLLSDQPQVPETLLRSLVERHAQTLAPLVAPMVDGRRANPVLFDRTTFEDLRKLEGDTGGRPLFARYPVEWLQWHDANVLLDVDTEEDYRRLLELDG
ncbi:MAG: selenium cofactor biosynthesis protein YqeC [Anaerolineales bacterium]|jgi:molybdenum cofactor cytidylyltransferase